MEPIELSSRTADQVVKTEAQVAGDRAHLRALYARLLHTHEVIKAAATAYIESRKLLDQIPGDK